MIWKVPKIWEDGTCYILGGGPSLATQFNIPRKLTQAVHAGEAQISEFSPYMEFLHDKHTIAINGSFRLGNWLDMCFFGDREWYFTTPNRNDILKFGGLVVTCAEFAKRDAWNGEPLKFLAKDERKYGISDNPSRVCWNYNSGEAAISIAANAGCKRIVLIGFDMQLVAGKGHFHNLYNGKTNIPFTKHLTGFQYIADDAKRRGIEIINASPISAITQFPKVRLKDLMNE